MQKVTENYTIRKVIIFIPRQILLGNKIWNSEMGRHVARMLTIQMYTEFWLENPQERNHLEDLSAERRKTTGSINLLKPTGHVMYQQFNIQQLYVLPTLYLYVLYLSENKQRLVPLTA